MAWRAPGFDPVRVLGSGATGTVVLSHDAATGSDVAIKYLSKRVFRARAAADIRHDIDSLASVDHPNLARIYQFVDGPGTGAVVTEMVDGPSLRALLNGGPLKPESACYILKCTLMALAMAHRNHIAHRDLRPENVLITTDATPKVVDVGLAVRAKRHSPQPGDPRYMAPEMWAGLPATPASDVFAAAVMLTETITGMLPRTAAGRLLGESGLTDDAGIAAILAPELPDRIRRMLAKELSHQPSRRSMHAMPMLDELELAALDAFGITWEENGLTQLSHRVARLVGGPAAAAANSGGRAGVVAAAMLDAYAVGSAPRPAGSGGDGDGDGDGNVPAAGAAAGMPSAGGTIMVRPDIPSPTAEAEIYAPVGSAAFIVEAEVARTAAGVATSAADGPDRHRRGALAGRFGRPARTLTAVGITVLLGTGLLAASSRLTGQDSSSRAAPGHNHSAIVNTGPSVPATHNGSKDVLAPTQPTGLRIISRSRTAVSIDWNASADNTSVAGYIVHRNGHEVGTTYDPGFTDSDLRPGSTYQYTVVAFDKSGNKSSSSSPISATTLVAADTAPPSVPAGLHVTGTGVSTIEVAWSASHDNIGVAGYDVFRDGHKIASVTRTSFIDRGLAAKSTHSYFVRAYDSSNNVSGSSGTVSATTQAKPPTTPSPPSATGTIDALSVAATNAVAGSCTVTVTATVTVSTAPVAGGGVSWMGDEIGSGTTAPRTYAVGPNVVDVVTHAVTAGGTVTVTIAGLSRSTTWTADPSCAPAPSPPPSSSSATSGSSAPLSPGGSASPSP